MAWAPDYVTLAEQKSYMRIDDDDDVDDALISELITSASRAIDSHCNRQFGLVAAPTEQELTPWGRTSAGAWRYTIPDLMTTTGLVVDIDGNTIDAADYRLTPRSAALRGRPWTGLDATGGTFGEATITASWGWSAVPSAVKTATKLQTSRFFIRRDSPFGVAGSPDNGNELRLLARVDADVAVALRGLVRPRGAM